VCPYQLTPVSVSFEDIFCTNRSFIRDYVAYNVLMVPAVCPDLCLLLSYQAEFGDGQANHRLGDGDR
jgi:hypothetical protein